uniref:RRM domain-containing protein n=1 Tax=Romanomermis culicivorax TaxID=13658 RepID=A0A915LAD2_ROMCU
MSSGHHSRRVNLRDDHVKREGDKHRERSPIERNNNGGTKDNDGAAGEDAGNDQMLKNKITSRCRLFVGNLNNDLKESELRELFEKYGDITEFFMSASKGFAFVRLDTRAHAETAKENLDGATVKGRQIRVRYAVHGASLKVSELSSTVSNELLAQAFSMFGVVERAVHILDDRSQPTGDGIIEFERKPAAIDAIRRINEGVFLVTAGNKPVFVEPLEPKDDEDGLAERMIPKSGAYQKDKSGIFASDVAKIIQMMV